LKHFEGGGLRTDVGVSGRQLQAAEVRLRLSRAESQPRLSRHETISYDTLHVCIQPRDAPHEGTSVWQNTGDFMPNPTSCTQISWVGILCLGPSVSS